LVAGAAQRVSRSDAETEKSLLQPGSLADFESAYQSEIGRKVAADSMAHVSKRDRLIVEENNIVDG
jgi:hypothetical protein